jgi:drug/metabolite transporter (DMT)-like permease
MSPRHSLLDRFKGSAEGNLKGMLIMLVAAVVLSVMQAIMRHITQQVHPLEAVFLRSVFALAFLSPWLLRVGIAEIRTTRPGLHLLRVVLNSLAQIVFFWGLALTPLAEVASLGFTAPLFVTVWAILFLGEVVGIRRWTALIVGFAGALVVFRPGFQEIHPGYLMILSSAALWSVVVIVLKVLTRTESTYTLTLYLTVSMAVITFVPALFVWQAPTLEQLLWLAGIGALGTIGHLLIAQSLHHAEASAVMPIDFTKLVWASALGYLAFAEVPDAWTLVGGTTIFVSTTYITLREVRLRRERGEV